MSDVTTVLSWINDAIFVSLVNTTLQITVLIPLIALFIWVFRIKSATTRYSLWLFAAFAIIALPILTPFTPQIDLAGAFRHEAAGDGLDDLMLFGMSGSAAGLSRDGDIALSTSAAKADVNIESDVPLINPVSIVYFIWCAGAFSMFCITIGVYVKLRKLRLGSSDIESQAALGILSRLRDNLGIRRTVALKTSSEIYAPISLGVFSPTVILPDSVIDSGSSDELEMILAHELAHIKRFDYLIRLLQNVLKVVFFFHPLFHLMKRNLAREREHICDDWVIEVTRRRSEYAECLVGLLERAIYGPVNIPVTLAMAERKQDIPVRVDMIVDSTRKTATKVSRKALTITLIIGCLSLPVIGGIGVIRFAPAQAPQQAQIAFQSDRDGNCEIYGMDADGKGPRNLTNNAKWNWDPAWSPDGQRIAFCSYRDKNIEIYVMDADGKNQRRLTNNPTSDGPPAWSPDGQKIAFCSVRDGNYEIYVMDADGKNPRNLTNNPAEDRLPGWFDPAFPYAVSPAGKLRGTWGKVKALF